MQNEKCKSPSSTDGANERFKVKSTQDFEVDKLALFFGANDFGGTILEEHVVTAAGKEYKPAKVEDIVKAVKSVGRPVAQRNTGYEVL